MDLIGVPRNLRLAVAERVKKEHGIDPANLAINASHTHSGPELRTSKIFGADDVALREKEAAEYTAKLEDTIVWLIGEAIQKSCPRISITAPARCGCLDEPPHAGWQRRLEQFPESQRPGGSDGAGVEGDERRRQRDRRDLRLRMPLHDAGPSEIQRRLRRLRTASARTGPSGCHGDVCMNGCSGDQNPYPRRTMELAQTHGKSLATSVEPRSPRT
jgi:neutral ceramidase